MRAMRWTEVESSRLRLAGLVIALSWVAGCASPSPTQVEVRPDEGPPVARRYVAGESVRYVMTGIHRGPDGERRYTAESEGRVERGVDGAFFEETRWIRLEVNGHGIALDDASTSFRQNLSLDPGYEMPFPDISRVNPMLIGPIFDLMTFYVDLHPHLHQGRLVAAGDHVHVPHGQPNRWADGTRVVLGEDCIDFDLTLLEVSAERAQLRVRHVPPAETSVALPAEWMRVPVGDAPNNWVQVVKDMSGVSPVYLAAVGTESFDVDIWVERPTGRIISATMDNPVDVIQRRCSDETLTECEDPVKYQIFRRIELRPAQ